MIPNAQGPRQFTVTDLERTWNSLAALRELRDQAFNRLVRSFSRSDRSTWREVLLQKARDLLGKPNARQLRARLEQIAKRPIEVVDLGTPDGALALAMLVGGGVRHWRTIHRALR